MMRRALLPMVLAFACAACAKSGTGPVQGSYGTEDGSAPAMDSAAAGTSDSAADDANWVDDAPLATACTAPPFALFTATVRDISATGSYAPLVGASVSFSTCGGFVVKTDNTGVASTQITKGIKLTPFFSAPGHISVVAAEAPGASDTALAIDIPLVASKAILPGYDTSKPMLEVVLLAAGVAPCDSVSGMALSIKNHSEGVAHYMATDWPADPAPTTSSSSVGPNVFFTGLAAGLTVQVLGTKSGCQLQTTLPDQTGNFSLVTGMLTIARAVVSNQ